MESYIKQILKENDMDFIKTLIENGIISLESFIKEALELDNDKYIYIVASYFFENSIAKLTDAIIAIKEAKYIYLYAKNVKGASITKLTDAIIETKNAEYIYQFARDVLYAPIEKLANALIELKDAKYIYFFAQEFENAPIEKLADALIETKNAEFIYYFARDVENAPIAKLIEALKDNQAYNYLILIALRNPQYLNLIADIIITSKNIDLIIELKNDVTNIDIKNRLQKAYDNLLLNYENSAEQKFAYLTKLYNDGNIEDILKQKDYFKELFTNSEEQPLTKKLQQNT